MDLAREASLGGAHTSDVYDIEEVETRLSKADIIALTCSAGGLQLIWSTIFSHGSAYLFSLGITQSQSSLIWAAVPFCGAFVQPLVGLWSDSCALTYGRRRPFLIGGAACSILCMLGLAWVTDIAKFLEVDEIKTFAIVLIVLLTVAIQPVQSGIRSLIVDACAPEQQANASAWASRFTGIGNIIGYFAASAPIARKMDDKEMSRFRFMAMLASSGVVITVYITCLRIKETSPKAIARFETTTNPRTCLCRLWRTIVSSIQEMPPRAKAVCRVQFFSGMAWFGFLFYSSTYVSHLFLTEEQRDGVAIPYRFHSDSMAVGSSANLLFAIVSLVASVVLPWFIDRASCWTGVCSEQDDAPTRADKSLEHMLPRLWAAGMVLYSFCVLMTLFVSSSAGSIMLIGLVGISWAITQWVPYAIISAEISSHRSESYQYSTIEAGVKGSPEAERKNSGIMMGLHNAAISLPQIFVALLLSIVFYIATETGHKDHAVAWVLRGSAGATLIAAYLILRGLR
ncbi:major facilitator superfamily domain-containing protein [Lophiotrema nucula]|uniref:Major facilitator superfamily domain-containing protein n=1 Tax=Lophiotrema nucula TaxID=690887 RepID=A0A6A5ZHD9_9PLEO|nr:major facilitator superfamily domain-containing protein [Lophiotrema nucula]